MQGLTSLAAMLHLHHSSQATIRLARCCFAVGLPQLSECQGCAPQPSKAECCPQMQGAGSGAMQAQTVLTSAAYCGGAQDDFTYPRCLSLIEVLEELCID
jgi:hypothetical protein